MARRRGLNGVLRALGATRKEIFLAVEAEVLVYALAGIIPAFRASRLDIPNALRTE